MQQIFVCMYRLGLLRVSVSNERMNVCATWLMYVSLLLVGFVALDYFICIIILSD
jgi:hypothetical protein